MKTALSLLVAASVVLASNLSAMQSSPASSSDNSGVPTRIQESEGELTAEVRKHLGRGDELIGRSRYDAAAEAYARAAEIARREGHLPSFSSWMVANAYYHGGNPAGAADALDKLANEAALVGDLGVEALAIYYSAWVNGKSGRRAEAEARIARLQGLLRSSYMPAALRDQLSDRLKSSEDVAVRP